jgi:spore germination protein YaaH
MIKKLFLVVMVFIFGFAISYLSLKYFLPKKSQQNIINNVGDKIGESMIDLGLKRESIGFLPFWLINSASSDYSKLINNISVFSLVVDDDGSIKKFEKPSESEPGYFSLINGKFDDIISKTKIDKHKLSLVLFSGKDLDIDNMLHDPVSSAQKLTTDVIPLVEKFGFDEINLDIEKVSDASPEARLKFKEFVSQVRDETNNKHLSLTIDVTASSFVKETNLVDPKSIAEYVDRIIIMAYDFHYMGSAVTGPVAPIGGAGISSEYDTETAIREALRFIKPEKIILGIPLYGYEWESINSFPRSAIIPGTGLIISNRKAEKFLDNCASCEAKLDPIDKETHIIYKDQRTGYYHQIFYPDVNSTKLKLELANKYKLAGVAFWALGYEGSTILGPLSAWNH